MNNELERWWKEVAMAQFEILFQHLPGGTEENQDQPPVRKARITAKI
jgi:hypothetical protein